MSDAREALCQKLGFANVNELHRFILNAVKGDWTTLRRRGLTPEKLGALGYTREALKRLGCSEPTLVQIFGDVAKSASDRSKPESVTGGPDGPSGSGSVKEMLAQGLSHSELKNRGVTVEHCRKAGAQVMDVMRRGFPMAEICRAYTLLDLRRAGLKVRDLSSHFSDSEMKSAGFSASEMRSAGRSIQDLRRAGYSDNHIRTAGYSTNELVAAGLSRQTRDFIKGS